MKKGHWEYRCKMCGEQFRVESGYVYRETVAALKTYAMPHKTRHECGVGKFGVAELLGHTLEEEQL